MERVHKDDFDSVSSKVMPYVKPIVSGRFHSNHNIFLAMLYLQFVDPERKVMKTFSIIWDAEDTAELNSPEIKSTGVVNLAGNVYTDH